MKNGKNLMLKLETFTLTLLFLSPFVAGFAYYASDSFGISFLRIISSLALFVFSVPYLAIRNYNKKITRAWKESREARANGEKADFFYGSMNSSPYINSVSISDDNTGEIHSQSMNRSVNSRENRKKEHDTFSKLALYIGIILIFAGYFEVKLILALSGVILLISRFLIMRFISEKLKDNSGTVVYMSAERAKEVDSKGDFMNNKKSNNRAVSWGFSISFLIFGVVFILLGKSVGLDSITYIGDFIVLFGIFLGAGFSRVRNKDIPNSDENSNRCPVCNDISVNGYCPKCGFRFK